MFCVLGTNSSPKHRISMQMSLEQQIDRIRKENSKKEAVSENDDWWWGTLTHKTPQYCTQGTGQLDISIQVDVFNKYTARYVMLKDWNPRAFNSHRNQLNLKSFGGVVKRLKVQTSVDICLQSWPCLLLLLVPSLLIWLA